MDLNIKYLFNKQIVYQINYNLRMFFEEVLFNGGDCL